MRVLENNCKSKLKLVENIPNTITVYCEHCESKLEITKDDTHIGWLGARYITCPCCGKEAMLDEMDGITLTIDNIEFPVHFLRTNKNTGAKEIEDWQIVDDIKKAITYFRNNKNEWCWYTSHGDLFLVVFRNEEDDEYFVLVTKDFYDTYIPFADEDKMENTNVQANNYM